MTDFICGLRHLYTLIGLLLLNFVLYIISQPKISCHLMCFNRPIFCSSFLNLMSFVGPKNLMSFDGPFQKTWVPNIASYLLLNTNPFKLLTVKRSRSFKFFYYLTGNGLKKYNLWLSKIFYNANVGIVEWHYKISFLLCYFLPNDLYPILWVDLNQHLATTKTSVLMSTKKNIKKCKKFQLR